MAKRVTHPRIVAVECPTPALFRWFLGNLRQAARSHPEGFIVDDEERWAMVLRNAEGRELWADHRLADKSRGEVVIRLRDGLVVGATGSEPERYIGLTLDKAKHLARFGAVSVTEFRCAVFVEGAKAPVHASPWTAKRDSAEHAAKNHRAMIRDRGWNHVVRIEERNA